ncbi:hypothetical protein BDN72DRAFT_886208 [Pluteus cervinus]|uniref:Uncharacterized protein n=1 Tax=Pluteus cervinus TaxID=181527 RepID=A0ACD3BB77_9AGAR|nr:hypothetical protein BDN72DRAFT_886208 [Pluteus cervinus]
MSLTALPSDLIILILLPLRVAELAQLARTCRLLNALVKEYGWAGYLRRNPRPSFSLSHTTCDWAPVDRVRYDILTDRAWTFNKFIARPLSSPWTGKVQPILAISDTRLALAAGNVVYIYQFASSRRKDGKEAPGLREEGVVLLQGSHEGRRDITSITFADDDAEDRTFYVGFHDGGLVLVKLPLTPQNELGHDDAGATPQHGGPRFIAAQITPMLLGDSDIADGDFVESLESRQDLLLSLTSTGIATLHDSKSLSLLGSHLELGTRGWTSLLSLRPSTPFAVFGTSSRNPLTVHAITNAELSSTPLAILHRNDQYSNVTSSAVYGICQPPLSSPWGSSPHVVVSGWYDGIVRCYDLRSSLRAQTDSHDTTPGPAPLRCVLSVSDPWSYEPIYSVSCGGGSSAHIAAGSARHSVVSFWDVRQPKTGWSVHAPGNDSSPVYTVILESSRLFGATQSRSFVYDFGPGVGVSTYPSLPMTTRNGLRLKKGNSIGYSVTKYKHKK